MICCSIILPDKIHSEVKYFVSCVNRASSPFLLQRETETLGEPINGFK